MTAIGTFAGTPLYMSPEMLSELPYSKSTDMWSLGVLLYELLTFSMPFESIDKIINSKTSFKPVNENFTHRK